jgi:hypothetical protein
LTAQRATSSPIASDGDGSSVRSISGRVIASTAIAGESIATLETYVVGTRAEKMSNGAGALHVIMYYRIEQDVERIPSHEA